MLLCLRREKSFFLKSPWANLRKYENVPWGILEIEISAIEVVFTWYQGPHRFLSNLRRCDYVNDLIFYSSRQFAKWRFAIIMCTEKRRICTPISSNFCIVVYSQNRLVLPKNANLYCCESKCIFLVKGVISYSTRTNSKPFHPKFSQYLCKWPKIVKAKCGCLSSLLNWQELMHCVATICINYSVARIVGC